MMKTKLIRPVALAIAAITLTACGGDNENQNGKPKAVKVEVIQVENTGTDSEARYSGTVEEASGTLLSFAVPGTVSSMLVEEGQSVRRGQLIATLDAEQLGSNYLAAKSQLAQAEDAYRRMKKLKDKGSLPEIKWVEAETTLKQARATEEVAAKQLRDCRLYAPFSGVISKKMAEKGQNVGQGTAVAKLVAVGKVKVSIAVPEGEIAQVGVGQTARVTVNALDGAAFTGKVTEKGISADPVSRSYDVKISIDNGGRRLMPGMVADVRLDGGQRRQTCVIPAHVVQIDEDNNEFVWLAVNGKATKRVITCGNFTATGLTVTGGLAGGDLVITKGQHNVSEGMAVKF